MALGDRIVVMEHGRVAQIGKPREIYQRPATRFVAEFIGTMNRLTGTTKDGVFACSAGNLPWAGAPATATEILFRPEDIRVAESGESTGLQGTVAAAFFLGDRTRLFVEVGEARPLVIESTARRDFSHGETVRLAIDPRGLLVL
jgi:putative spermidine/putrescine transport system ATP-binding protein